MPSIHTIEIDNRLYPIREIILNRHSYCIGTIALNNALFSNNGDYKTIAHQRIDEEIVFYIDNSDILKPDTYLYNLLMSVQ